jgi:hypothetical protein
VSLALTAANSLAKGGISHGSPSFWSHNSGPWRPGPDRAAFDALRVGSEAALLPTDFLPSLAKRLRSESRQVSTVGPARNGSDREASNPFLDIPIALACEKLLRQACQASGKRVHARPHHNPCPKTHRGALVHGSRMRDRLRGRRLLLRLAAQVQQEIRNVDLYRADLAARSTK